MTTPRQTPELVDEIAASIRREVAVGRFPMGSKLRQEALAAEFGVSRTPIREALRQLQAEGLAAELAARLIEDADLRALTQAERRFRDVVRAAAKAKRPDASRIASSWADANDAFHEIIQRAARNDTLRRTINFLHRSIPRGLTGNALVASPKLLETNAREHAAIRDVIDRRDGDRAYVLMRDHILRSGEIAASWFELQEVPSGHN